MYPPYNHYIGGKNNENRINQKSIVYERTVLTRMLLNARRYHLCLVYRQRYLG